MAGDYCEAAINNLMKQGKRRALIVVSNERFWRVPMYDVRLTSIVESENKLSDARLYLKRKVRRGNDTRLGGFM
jgi:hypothetical protein